MARVGAARCGDRLRGRLLYSPLFPRPSRGLVCPTRLRASLVAPTWRDSETFIVSLSIAREHQDVTYCRCPSKPGGAGVAACPTREGASDHLGACSAGGVNGEQRRPPRRRSPPRPC